MTNVTREKRSDGTKNGNLEGRELRKTSTRVPSLEEAVSNTRRQHQNVKTPLQPTPRG